MKKILISTIGTTGDVKPFKHLAEKLKHENYYVQVCSFSVYEEIFVKSQIDFYSVGNQVEWSYVQDVVEEIINAPTVFQELKIMTHKMIMLDFDQRYKTLLEKMKDVDLAIIHIADAAAQAVAEELGKPWVLVRFETTSVPTSYISSPPVMKNFGRFFNDLTWKAGELILSKFDSILDKKLNDLGFTNWDNKPVLVRHQSRFLNLCACSPILSPHYPDLPDSFKITGQWFSETNVTEESSYIIDFAKKNENNFVLVTLGSMGGGKGRLLAQIFIQAFEQLGLKAIIQKGVADIYDPDYKSEDIIFCDYIPHELVMPMSRFIIHHAGSGTAHSVLRFQRPSICIPHILDQEFFSKSLLEIGVSPGSVAIRSLSTSRLIKLCKKLLENYSYYEKNSLTYGEKIQQEDGLESALKHVQQQF